MLQTLLRYLYKKKRKTWPKDGQKEPKKTILADIVPFMWLSNLRDFYFHTYSKLYFSFYRAELNTFWSATIRLTRQNSPCKLTSSKTWVWTASTTLNWLLPSRTNLCWKLMTKPAKLWWLHKKSAITCPIGSMLPSNKPKIYKIKFHSPVPPLLFLFHVIQLDHFNSCNSLSSYASV